MCINQWVLFEEPPNVLSALFKHPDQDYFTDVLPKLTITFMVRDWNDDTWISVGHKIRFTLDTHTRQATATVLPDREKTDEILQIAHVLRKKTRSYLSFTMRFAVFGTPYPLWNWAASDTFAAGAEISQLRLEVFEATYTMYAHTLSHTHTRTHAHILDGHTSAKRITVHSALLTYASVIACWWNAATRT